MLKKLLVTTVALSATLAYGDINVNWFGSLGFYDNGTGPAPGTPDYIGSVFGTATAQLIWSPDSGISEIDVANGANGWVSDGEVVLDTFTVTSTFGDYSAVPNPFLYTDASFSGQTGGTPLDQGFIYARIFGTAAPVVGEYYHASTPFDPGLPFDPNSPSSVTLNQNLGSDPTFGAELDREIVPEPSVLAFLGLAGLLMAVRRRK